MKTLSPEQRKTVKTEIEKAAKSNKITILQQISAMQSKCVDNKNEDLLTILCDIKNDYFSY